MNFDVNDEEQQHDKDTLLSLYRRRWRGPVALTEQDFLHAFIEVDRANTLASVIARLKQGEWRTSTAFARHFRKPARWAMSFKFFMKRQGLIAQHDDFDTLFNSRNPKP